MKIYPIPVDDKFQPERQSFVWPPTNQLPNEDRGVENDFQDWLFSQPELIASNPQEADWCYAPIFYNRYFFENLDADGHWGGGIDALNEEVQSCLKFGEHVFTIAEADVRTIYPSVNFGNMQIFCASRRADLKAIDIPLLCGAHPIPATMPKKKWLACFQGNLATDSIRMQMRDKLAERKDCLVQHAGVSEAEFAQTIMESYIALAPRGQGVQSFRMYEAMQLGTVPLYISDLDCRPFRNWIDWDICSLRLYDAHHLDMMMEEYSQMKDKLLTMGVLAQITYCDHLSYGRWCKYVIKELELL